ncbi:unnamed protein product [Merluccius merluccius]
MKLSSAKMNSDLLTVRQFWRCGTGLYRAMVRARCALACFRDPDVPDAETASWPSADAPPPPPPLPPSAAAASPSPESMVLG